jgi:hypothetical protein
MPSSSAAAALRFPFFFFPNDFNHFYFLCSGLNTSSSSSTVSGKKDNYRHSLD